MLALVRVSQPRYTGQWGPSPFSRLPFLTGRTQVTTLVDDIIHPAPEWQSPGCSGAMPSDSISCRWGQNTESHRLGNGSTICTYILTIISGCVLSSQSIIKFYRVLLSWNSLSEWHQLGEAGTEAELHFKEVYIQQEPNCSWFQSRTSQLFQHPKILGKL